MRKITLSIITAFVLCLTILMTGVSALESVVYGDVNKDGQVAVTDATDVQRTLAKITELDESATLAADVNGDDDISVIDATLIQQYVAKIIDKFPVEEEENVTTPTEPSIKVNPEINIYFSNNRNWKTVYAYIYNNETGETMSTWPGTVLTESTVNSYGEVVFSMKADTSKYNRIIFSNGTAQTTDTPLTVANSGYFIMTPLHGKFVCGMYPYGQENEGTIKQVNLEYSKGYNKRITIWTPVGYDANDTSKKYSVLYMTDGQNIFGNDENSSPNEWEVDETVLSYMQNGGDGIIVVGIDNANAKRDSELTPDIGDVVPSYNNGGFRNGTGQAYSEFVVNKVIPYIDANYNTNDVRGIAGSSSGGIESFYIGMENMDKFDYIGAISPAFLLYSESTWNSYLSKFDFSDESALPRIYFFNGNSKNDSLEQELYPSAVAMQGWMEKKGYPSSLMKTVVDNDATHNELFWAVYFPEALTFGLGY
ncbi:MAG: starch-binding protein [Ruminococcus sp.]|nr:starch-binding protein [Ruminococcus sp.]